MENKTKTVCCWIVLISLVLFIAPCLCPTYGWLRLPSALMAYFCILIIGQIKENDTVN